MRHFLIRMNDEQIAHLAAVLADHRDTHPDIYADDNSLT